MNVDEARGLDSFQWPLGHGLLLRKRSLWRGRRWSRASARDETGLGEAGRKQRIESDLTRFVEVFQNGDSVLPLQGVGKDGVHPSARGYKESANILRTAPSYSDPVR